MKRYIAIPLLLSQFILHIAAYAQTAHPKNNPYADDFVPGENVVFYDDFSEYKEGVFPSRWEILDSDYRKDNDIPTIGIVTKMDSVSCLFFKQGNGLFARPVWDTTNYSTLYQDSYWTIEFDFRFIVVKNDNENCITVNVSQNLIGFDRYLDGSNKEAFSMSSLYSSWTAPKADYPVPFNKTAWHHFAVSVKQGAISGYVDHFKLLSYRLPQYYISELLIQGRAQVAIKNFKLAYTDTLHPKKLTPDALLTVKKFTTHAINFDKNKAVINPESMSFMHQLAAFLKANPAIKLEIDGHTDSDGTPDANMKLSENRAEAIKKELMKIGIKPERLSAKGFGETRPIETNATPEGMAQNRRVEFVKQ